MASDRFLPIRATLEQLLAEHNPKLSAGPGSALGDLLITPASLIQQQARDRLRVIQRNQSLKNYGVMLDDEFDRLSSNYLVSRAQGTQSVGIQRVFFQDIRAIQIETSAVFSDSEGNRYLPTQAVRLTSAELAANFLPDSNEYYADVTTQSEGIGAQFRAAADQVTRVEGVAGASRTTNVAAYSGGANVESNSELYARILSSLTNRELVKSDAIKASVQAAFAGVTQVIVQGYGDEGMTRDLAQVGVDASDLFPASFCEKVNLPLDELGNVLWSTVIDDEVASPLGGFVGAVYDISGLDFNAVPVSTDGGKTVRRISLQEGMKIRFTATDDPDVLGNDYTITRIEEVPVAAGGVPVKVARLDRPLKETNVQLANVPITSGRPYTARGTINYDAFHIGGKVDVLIDSDAVVSKTVTINVVPALLPGGDVAEIPMIASATDPLNNPLFENGVGFASPTISVTKVEQLDATSDEVLRTLTPDTHYAIVRAEDRSKFTHTEDDLLVIRGSEPVTGIEGVSSLPLWIGTRIRVTYVTDPTVDLVQAYLTNSTYRNVTADIIVKAPERVLLDIQLNYKGTIAADLVQETLRAYVDNTGFGAEITVNEIISLLSWLGVTDVQFPVVLQSREDTVAGRIQYTESEDRLSTSGTQLFLPIDTLSITKLDS